MSAIADLDPGPDGGVVPVSGAPARGEQPSLVVQIARIRSLLEAFRDGEPPALSPEVVVAAPESALDRLARLLRLSPFEREVLLLTAAVELDGDVAALAAAITGGNDPRPTFGLALAALPGAHWDALAPDSPLRHWRLLELGAGPLLASRPLRIDERVLHYLTGIPATDERLGGVLRAAIGPGPLAPSQRRIATDLARTLAATGPALIRLDGDDLEARLDVACQVAVSLGLVPLVIRAAALPAPGPDLAALARLVDREAIIAGGLVILDPDGANDTVVAAWLDLLDAPWLVVAGEHGGSAPGRLGLQRSVRLPSPAEQRGLWVSALGERLSSGLRATVEEVAQHHRLGAAAVDAIARELVVSRTEPADLAATLRRLCRERARGRLDGLAERIDPKAGWDDLVLPAGHLELLQDVARHVRHRTQVYERWGFGDRVTRGLGVTALFAGESGTGKTLAAEVLAAHLGLDLYRIDLSATVSKYIGETEKNLRRLFDAAEVSGAVLLFDEADALFGRRGEVKDSHDRYANLEVAYLLQRMETYQGLAILTTNMRSHIDHAFLRRLRFVIQFPFPDHAQRADIWRRIFPPATPLEGLDPDELARLTVPGGSIRAIALSAAFAAAEEGTPVTPVHVVRAARIEYAKSERSLTDIESAGLR